MVNNFQYQSNLIFFNIDYHLKRCLLWLKEIKLEKSYLEMLFVQIKIPRKINLFFNLIFLYLKDRFLPIYK